MKTKPCPFCGSTELDMMRAGINNYVECFNCLARGCTQSTDKLALMAWNRAQRWAITELTYDRVPYEGLLLDTATIIDNNGRTWKVKDCHLDCVGDEVPGGGYAVSTLTEVLEILKEGQFINLDIEEVDYK